MNTTSLPQANVLTYSEFGAVQTRYFLASFNLIFVLAAGALMYAYAASGAGSAAGEDLVVGLIRTFCVFGGAAAGCAWLFSWAQLRQLKSE